MSISPILLEVIEGTIESSMWEMNLQVDRTARFTVIREQHDHRSGIFDARGRSISSVSFAANVDPILKRYAGEVRQGDIFIWNDCYQSEGGITHLPDICVTTPVIEQEEVAAYVQIFGHVEDVGGILTGSLPIASTEIYQEGIMIPPVKLYDQGKLNRPLYETILNNSRFPDSLQGDIDAEVSALQISGAGSGGRYYADGTDAVDVAPESKNMPCEFAEAFFSAQVERLGLRRDSGGPGRYRGGLGYCKEIHLG